MSLLKGQVEVLHQNGDQKGILAFEPFGCSLVSFVLLGKMHCVVLGYQGKFLNILVLNGCAQIVFILSLSSLRFDTKLSTESHIHYR